MDLDLGGVASFLVLVEEEHYGRAAERLHVTPSALTKRIQRLERQLGVPLLVRDAAGVAGPTAAGVRFAREAGPLLAHARAARAVARADPPLVTVHLGVLGRIGDCPERQQVAEVGRRFRRRYPDVRLVCRPVPYPAMTTCLLNSAVDVVWGVPAAGPPAVDLVPLIACERVAVVAASHELADAAELHPADLVDLPMLHNPAVPSEWMAPFVLGDVRPARDARLVEIEATNATSVFAQMTRGAGVITTTPWLAAALGPGLRAVRLVGLPPMRFYAARRHTDRREPVLTLVDLLQQVAASATTSFADAVPTTGPP